MPPRRVVHVDPPGMFISLRLKYGIHTIFLLVDPLGPFSNITGELLSILHDRCGAGLRANIDDEPVPLASEDADVHVAYGVLKDPHDSGKGWKDLKIQGDETPVSKGLKSNDMVAFVMCDAKEVDDRPEFIVRFPKYGHGDEE